MTDQFYMLRALRHAESSIGMASPNPQVGCVIVSADGRIAGEGAHLYDRRDHAEIVALRPWQDAGQSLRGATAYVTLEPCSHHGRTPPCADALIGAGIAQCFVATVDPNPAVAGRGIAKLRAAGVEVHVGLEQARARRLNEAFAKSIQQQRPFVHLKSALSVDGRLAPLEQTPGTPHWLTGPDARLEVQLLRHASDAILTGIGTVLADDPLLTDRSGLPRRRPLMRVVLDSRLRLPLTSALVRSAAGDLWVICGSAHEAEKRSELERLGVRVSELPLLELLEVLELLHREHCLSVLVEAGMGLNSAFLGEDLVDRATLFYAPTELGPASLPFSTGGPTPFALEERMSAITNQSFGPDVCVSGLLHDPWANTPNFV